MKTASIFTFAVGALAAITRRQSGSADDLPAALKAITSATNDLNSAVQAFTSDIGPVNSATEAVLSAIKSANTLASSLGELTVDQAVAASGPTQELNTAVATAIDSTISKKDAFVAACQGPAVYSALQEQQSASSELSTAIVSHLPQPLQDLGRQASAPSAASLEKGLAAFKDAQGCNGSSSSASSSAAATSAAATSAASAAASSTKACTAKASASAAASAAPSAAANGTTSADSTAAGEAPATYTGAGIKTVASFGAVAAAMIAVAAF